jgi:hypothetical protein
MLFYPSLDGAKILDYRSYLEMNGDQKQKYIKKYVKEKNNLFECRVRYYDVYSDVSPEVTFEISVLMDDFYRQFSSRFKGKFVKKDRPPVYVMKDQVSYLGKIKQLIDYDAPEWSAGLYGYRGRTRALFCNHSVGEQYKQTMKHEGLHQLLDFYIGGEIPTWFNEGTATIFETFKMKNSMKMNLSLNLWNSNYPWELKRRGLKTLIPLKNLFKVTEQEWNASEDPALNYLSSWCVVYFLLSTKDGLDLYNDLLTNLRKKRNLDKVLKASKVKALQSEFDKFIHDRVMAYVSHIPLLDDCLNKNIESAFFEEHKLLKLNYADSAHVVFYRCYGQLVFSEDVDGKKVVGELNELEKKGYLHPMMDYLYGLAWLKRGTGATSKSKAKYYFRRQLANMPDHVLSQQKLEEL